MGVSPRDSHCSTCCARELTQDCSRSPGYGTMPTYAAPFMDEALRQEVEFFRQCGICVGRARLELLHHCSCSSHIPSHIAVFHLEESGSRLP